MGREIKLAVAGEDRRMQVMYAALEKAGYLCVPLREAADCAAAVLPMPYSGDGVTVTDTEVSLARLFASLPARFPVLGGRIDKGGYLLAMQTDIRLFDYYSPETVQICNAALTAEGAIDLAAEQGWLTDGAQILVCGFGRIGKCLMSRLRGMGAHTTVSARSAVDLAWARALDYPCVETARMDCERYDLIFNTVPVRVFDRRRLLCMKDTVTILDLASAPYGTDLAAAAELGRQAITAPALPAKCFPERAGEVLAESVLTLLGETGCEI